MTYIKNKINQNVTISVPTDYGTVEAALASISDVIINDNVTVTIYVEAGVHSLSTAETWEHPYAKNIRIVGATPLERTITFASYVMNSAIDYTITYNCLDMTSITTDCYLMITPTMLNGGASGTYYLHGGCWKVIAIDTSDFDVTNTAKNHSASTSVSFDAKILRSVYAIDAQTYVGEDTPPYGSAVIIKSAFKSIENIVFDGGLSYPTTNSTIGISIGPDKWRGFEPNHTQRIVFENCGFVNYAYPFVAHSSIEINTCAFSTAGSYGVSVYSSFKGNDISTNGNGAGASIYATGESLINNIWVCGNSGYGIFSDSGMKMRIDNVIIAYNDHYGMQATQTDVTLSNASILNNASYGIATTRSSEVRFHGTCVITGNNGTSADLLATYQGRISKGSAAVTGTYTLSPSANTWGNNNSYIRW